jgi:hypothetical protein
VKVLAGLTGTARYASASFAFRSTVLVPSLGANGRL